MEGDEAAEDDDGNNNRFALLGLDDDDHVDEADEDIEGGRGHDDDGDGDILSQQSQKRLPVTDPTSAAAAAAAAEAEAAEAVGEALVGVGVGGPSPRKEEDHMGNDPYDPDDWKKFAVDEEEAGFDNDLQAQYLGFNDDDDDIDESDDSDVDSLMDHGLAEVDNILWMKGRLSVLDPPRGQEATARDTPQLDKRKPPPQIEEGGRDKQGAGGAKHSPASTLELPGHRDVSSARGTGAQAATSLKSATAQFGGVSFSPRTTSGPSQPAATASNNATDETFKGRQPNRGKAPHVVASMSGGNNSLHGCSPSPSPTRRRRREKEPPFIQAKGLTLTYAQAKLFGLVDTRDDNNPPPPSIAEASKIIRNSNATTWPRSSSSRENATTGRRSRGQVRERQQHNRTSYSPSRMEHLARPVPGRGRINANEGVGSGGGASHGRGGGGGGGRGAEASFTWKRSRRAEAAMRDPACGYDFVREACREGEGFLRRVEAYSSYSRAKIETRRAEDVYAARLDKLECPRCQNPQSYDEFSAKKLKCPGCEATYCMSKTWNRRVWDQRNQMCAAKSEERQAKMERETEEAFRTGLARQSRHAALLRQQVGQVDFIRRMRRDLRRRRAREGTLTAGLQKNPAVGVGIDDDDDQHAGSRKTRPASAPIRSKARAAAVAAVAAAQPPRRATAEEGAKRVVPRATPSTVGRQKGSTHLPVTPEARAVSCAARPAAISSRPYGITPPANSDQDVLVAGPYGTTPPANSNRGGLVAGPFGTTPPLANSNEEGLVAGVSSRSPSCSSSSVVRRPASAGARTAAASATACLTKNSMQVRTAVGSLKR